jgi:hypothetical protein
MDYDNLLFRPLVLLCLSITFLVYLCLVFRMVDIYKPVVECEYVPFFADVLSIYSYILLFLNYEYKMIFKKQCIKIRKRIVC